MPEPAPVITATWPLKSLLAEGTLRTVPLRDEDHIARAQAGSFGSPDELTTRGLISVFVDLAAGMLVMAVAVWSIRSRGRESRGPSAPSLLRHLGRGFDV